MELSASEWSLLTAAVDAEDRGDDADDAVRAVPHQEGDSPRGLVLSRLHDRGLLEVDVGRNANGDIYIAYVKRVLPAGLDAVRTDRPVGVADVLSATELRQLEPIVAEVAAFIEAHESDLDRGDVADLSAQLKTIQAQLLSPRPRRAVVTAALTGIKWVLDHAAGEVVGAATMVGVQQAIRVLGG